MIGCIKRVCQNSQDVNNSSPAIDVNGGTPDIISEENKTVNYGSPEQSNGSHEQSNGSQETNSEPPEMNHQQDIKPYITDDKVNGKPSPELNDNLPNKNDNKLENCVIPEQESSVTHKQNSHKQNSELPEQNKSSPVRLALQNYKPFGKSPEQVDRSHDQNCVSPVDKGRLLESDGKLLSRSLEQDFSLSLKLQINKLCQQKLYRQLELFNKSAEQQTSRTLDNEEKPCGLTNSYDNKCRKKTSKSCVKSSMIKFNQSPDSNRGSGKDCGINLCLTNNMPSLTNHVSPLSVLKTPSLFGLCTPPKCKTGVKRKSLLISSPPNMKKRCDDTRADLLTTLPAAFMYSDILAELKRRSVDNYFHPIPACRQPTRDWESLHSIYHDHSYACDYVPLTSTTSEEELATVCDGCAGQPLFICVNCNRCVHKWCISPGCSTCEDCLNGHNLFALV